MTKRWTQSKCQSMGKRVNKMWLCSYNECHSAIKRNKVRTHALMWMTPKNNGLQLVLWYRRLSHHCNTEIPYQKTHLGPHFSASNTTYCLHAWKSSGRWPNYLGPYNPCRRSSWSSWILTLVYSKSGYLGHFGEWINTWNRVFSISISLTLPVSPLSSFSVVLPFKYINI